MDWTLRKTLTSRGAPDRRPEDLADLLSKQGFFSSDSGSILLLFGVVVRIVAQGLLKKSPDAAHGVLPRSNLVARR